MDATNTITAPARPVIRRITVDDVYRALSAGWADFRAAPRFGLFFGGVYAAAGILIVTEAGGRVTGWPGDRQPPLESGRIVATNGLIHAWMADTLDKFVPPL